MMDGVIERPSQPDLPAGKMFTCMECGTRLRSGQPHTALAPRPHQTLSLLIVTERIEDDIAPYVAGSHAGITGYRPQLRAVGALSHGSSKSSYYNWKPGREALTRQGRLVEGTLVQDPVTLTWKEVA